MASEDTDRIKCLIRVNAEINSESSVTMTGHNLKSVVPSYS